MMNRNDFLKALQALAPLKGKTVCAAFSGGPDSLALLHLLCSSAAVGGFSVTAVHINHGLRGEEAERDERFCRDFCRRLQVELTVFRVDCKAERLPGESTELCARRLRYRCFEKVTADYIATAHHADDAAETFLLNFVRGSGLKGLCGIPPVRDRYLRPLLGFSRQQLLLYLEAQGLSYVTDSTNCLPTACNRNRLRHTVMPVLHQINSRFSQTAAQNFSLLWADSNYLEQTAAAVLKQIQTNSGLPALALSRQHPAIAARVVQQYLAKFHCRVDALHLKAVLALLSKKGGGRVQLFGNRFCAVRGGYLYYTEERPLHYRVCTRVVSKENLQNELIINNLLLKNTIDYDKILNELKFRVRQPGDSFIPAGGRHTKAVRRLQAEAGILPEQRCYAPLAVDDGGVVWGMDIGVANRVAVSAQTQKVLIFEVRQQECELPEADPLKN